MKNRLDRWHDCSDMDCTALSRDDVCCNVADEESFLEVDGTTVRSLLRRVSALQAMDRDIDHEHLLLRARNVRVMEESSVLIDDDVELPSCPFIDNTAQESNVLALEDEKGFSYISDMTEYTT
jgi:hypothetical protein